MAYNFDRNKHIKQTSSISEVKYIGLDFNVSKMCAVFVTEYSDGKLYAPLVREHSLKASESSDEVEEPNADDSPTHEAEDTLPDPGLAKEPIPEEPKVS